MDAHICGRCGHLWAMHTGYSDHNQCRSPGCICERSQCNAEKHNNEDAREAIRVLAAYIAGVESGASFARVCELQRQYEDNPIARAAALGEKAQ